jgi:hypothetical protein
MHDTLQIKSLLKCPRKRIHSAKKMIIMRMVKHQDIQGQTFLRYGINVGYGKLISKLKHQYAFFNCSNWWTYASYIKVCEKDLLFTPLLLWYWKLKSSFLYTDVSLVTYLHGNHNKSLCLKYSASGNLCTFGSLPPFERWKHITKCHPFLTWLPSGR